MADLSTPDLFVVEQETDLRKSFHKSRGPNAQRLHNRGGFMRSDFDKYLKDLLKSVSIRDTSRIVMGPLKDPDRIEEKAETQYRGDRRQVGDVVRATLYLNAGPELDSFLKKVKLDKPMSLAKHFDSDKVRLRRDENGIVVPPKIHIKKPKKWGWMGIYLKVEIIKDGDPFPAEIQIYPEGMKEAYKQTHALYSQIRTSIEEWEHVCSANIRIGKAEPRLGDILSAEEMRVVQQILAIHKEAAEKCGLLGYVPEGSFPSIDNMHSDHLMEEDVSNPYNEELICLHYSVGKRDKDQRTALLTPGQVEDIWHIIKSAYAAPPTPFLTITPPEQKIAISHKQLEQKFLIEAADGTPFTFTEGKIHNTKFFYDMDELTRNMVIGIIETLSAKNIAKHGVPILPKQEMAGTLSLAEPNQD